MFVTKRIKMSREVIQAKMSKLKTHLKIFYHSENAKNEVMKAHTDLGRSITICQGIGKIAHFVL